MTLPKITLDIPTLTLALSIVGGLLLLSMVRILFLLRTNKRLRQSAEKMEKQVLTQHGELLAVRQDSNAWRGETQRMFDAFRAEFSKRLDESEQRYRDLQTRLSGVGAATAFSTEPAEAPTPPSFVTAKPSFPGTSSFFEPAPPAAEKDDGTVPPVPALSFS